MSINSIYITSLEAESGKSLIVLGVMELLTRTIGRVGFFRPVARSQERGRDPNISLVSNHFRLDLPDNEMYGVTAEEARQLILEEKNEKLLKIIFEKFMALEKKCDFVVCEGTDFTSFAQSLEFDFNAKIAANLGTPLFIVIKGKDRAAGDTLDILELAREVFVRENCAIAAAVLNRSNPAALEELKTFCTSGSNHNFPVFVIPEDPRLTQMTLNDVQEALKAKPLLCKASDLMREVRDIKVAAMTIDNFLKYVKEGSMIVTPGDRGDIIVSCLMATISDNYPSISGLLLTGGLTPGSSIERLLEGLPFPPMPILSVNDDTMAATEALGHIKPRITADNKKKIATALDLFETCVDSDELFANITVTRPRSRTPISFEYELIQRAKTKTMHIVLPEGTDERILQAAEILVRRKVVQVTLLGDPDSVQRTASVIGVNLEEIAIIDPLRSELRQKYAEVFYELRRAKGATFEQAYDVVSDVSYFGTMMVYCGDANGMVSGAAHTTQHTVRPSFQTIRTKPGVSVVSSVFLMCLQNRVVVFGDCAVIPEPTPKELADIAISSAETAKAFGIEPRVALLSYSTGQSGSGLEVDKVREAAAIAQKLRPDLPLEGPLQFDAAFEPSVAAKKAPGSRVAGEATVFVFPDLNTGNNTYKAVQRTSGAVAIGPILQGLNKPVNDLSRGCTVTDIVNTVAITAIQAQIG